MVLRDSKIILRSLSVSHNFQISSKRHSWFWGTVNYIEINDCLSEINLAEPRFTVLRDSINILRTMIVSPNQISPKQVSRFWATVNSCNSSSGGPWNIFILCKLCREFGEMTQLEISAYGAWHGAEVNVIVSPKLYCAQWLSLRTKSRLSEVHDSEGRWII